MARSKPAPSLDPTDHAGIASAVLARLYASDQTEVVAGDARFRWSGSRLVVTRPGEDARTVIEVANPLAVRGELVQAAIAGVLS